MKSQYPRCWLSFASLVLACCPGSLRGQDWADLKMTVQWDAPIPPAPRPAFGGGFGQPPIADEALLVDSKSMAIENVVLMIDERMQTFDRKSIHPDLIDAPESPTILTMKQFRFSPHVLFIRTGQILRFENRDGRGYNAKINFLYNDESNLMLKNGNIQELRVIRPEKVPISVECNIHPWMRAFLIVADHPYVGISDAAGTINIEKLPAGIPITFRLWHESQNKSIETVNLAGQAQSWPKGSVTITLKKGLNDLGTLLLKPERFR